MKEGLVELAPLHLLGQVAVGGEQETDGHRALLLLAHPPVGAGLEHAQERGLHLQRQLADLVEKQGRVVGERQQPLAGLVGPGERALDVAEQLAPGQLLLQRGAVLDDHLIAGQRRALVDEAGDHILARARLAGDEHRDARRRHLVDEELDVAHRLGVADEPHPLPFAAGGAAEHGVLPGERRPLVRLFHHQVETVEVERLADEVVGPELHGLHGDVHVAVAGDHDHLHVGDGFAGADEQAQVAHVRQPQVHDDHVEPMAAQLRQGLGAVRGHVDLAAGRGQLLLQQAADRLLVVDHQDGVPVLVHACTPGRATRNADPWPAALVTLISPLWLLTMA